MNQLILILKENRSKFKIILIASSYLIVNLMLQTTHAQTAHKNMAQKQNLIPELIPNCTDCNVLIFNHSSFNPSHSKFYNYHRDTDGESFSNLKNILVFKNHFTTSTWPFSANISLLTGKYPHEHKVFLNYFHNNLNYSEHQLKEDKINKNHSTLFEIAQKNNFFTALVGGSPHPSFFSETAGFARGVDFYRNQMLHYHDQIQIVDELLLKTNGKRFVVMLNTARTHFPHFLIPQNFKSPWVNQKYSGKLISTEEEYLGHAGQKWEKIHQMLAAEKHTEWLEKTKGKKYIRDAYWYVDMLRQIDGKNGDQHLIDLYDQAIAYSDWFLAQTIQRLREKNILNKTIILITSDVGDNALIPYTDTKTKTQLSSYSYAVVSPESARIPLVIYHPSFDNKNTGQQNIEDLITNQTDILPTIVDILNLKNAKKFSGKSLNRLKPQHRSYSTSLTFRPHRGLEIGVHDKDGSLVLSKGFYHSYQFQKKEVSIQSVKEKNQVDINHIKKLEAFKKQINTKQLEKIEEKVVKPNKE